MLKRILAGAALCCTVLLCGCSEGIPFTGEASPDFTAGWMAQAEIICGDNTARAEVTRSEPDYWEFSFTEPQELSGVIMRIENGKASASLGELTAEVGNGDFTLLPEIIAGGIDSLEGAQLTENDGVLTAKVTFEGSKCVITADKATGDILSLKCPESKLAVYFSETAPYTEEVGLITTE